VAICRIGLENSSSGSVALSPKLAARRSLTLFWTSMKYSKSSAPTFLTIWFFRWIIEATSSLSFNVASMWWENSCLRMTFLQCWIASSYWFWISSVSILTKAVWHRKSICISLSDFAELMPTVKISAQSRWNSDVSLNQFISGLIINGADASAYLIINSKINRSVTFRNSELIKTS